jgi:hypothetical protein
LILFGPPFCHLNLTFNLITGDDEAGLRASFREVLPELHVAM